MSNGYGYTLYPGGHYPSQSPDWQSVMTGMITRPVAKTIRRRDPRCRDKV